MDKFSHIMSHCIDFYYYYFFFIRFFWFYPLAPSFIWCWFNSLDACDFGSKSIHRKGAKKHTHIILHTESDTHTAHKNGKKKIKKKNWRLWCMVSAFNRIGEHENMILHYRSDGVSCSYTYPECFRSSVLPVILVISSDTVRFSEY